MEVSGTSGNEEEMAEEAEGETFERRWPWGELVRVCLLHPWTLGCSRAALSCQGRRQERRFCPANVSASMGLPSKRISRAGGVMLGTLRICEGDAFTPHRRHGSADISGSSRFHGRWDCPQSQPWSDLFVEAVQLHTLVS